MSNHIKHYKYSEIFGDTFQGEGKYTGVPTVWLRFWGCNLSCSGFGQKDPCKPETWDLDYQNIPVDSIKRIEDLPVFDKGCDSSYSWAKKFSHLAHSSTASEICDKLEDFLKSPSNPEGKFKHATSGQWTHMAFTGGEPMMNQTAIVEIMLEFARRGNVPKYVTVETNGTQKIRSNLSEYITGYAFDQDGNLDLYKDDFDYSKSFYMTGQKLRASEQMTSISPELAELCGIEWFWSVSPKLSLSGEKWDDAVKPEVVASYFQTSIAGQLKYVSDGSDQSWEEIERATKLYRDVGINWPVWIMPVGATADGQRKVQAMVAEGAVSRGYNVAARVHCFVFDNVIGK